jgi:hypothetical protein
VTYKEADRTVIDDSRADLKVKSNGTGPSEQVDS